MDIEFVTMRLPRIKSGITSYAINMKFEEKEIFTGYIIEFYNGRKSFFKFEENVLSELRRQYFIFSSIGPSYLNDLHEKDYCIPDYMLLKIN